MKKIEVGKYYTFDVNAAGKDYPNFFGIVKSDIEIFKNGKARLCVFAEYKDNFISLYFEGQKGSNCFKRFGKEVKYWNWSCLEYFFKEVNVYNQEEMEI